MNIWHSIGKESKCKQYFVEHPEIKHIWTAHIIPPGYDIKYWQEDDTLYLEPFDYPVNNTPEDSINQPIWGKGHIKRFSKRFKKRTCCVCSHVIKLKEIFIERTEHNGGFQHNPHSFCFHHGLQHVMRKPVMYNYKEVKS